MSDAASCSICNLSIPTKYSPLPIASGSWVRWALVSPSHAILCCLLKLLLWLLPQSLWRLRCVMEFRWNQGLSKRFGLKANLSNLQIKKEPFWEKWWKGGRWWVQSNECRFYKKIDGVYLNGYCSKCQWSKVRRGFGYKAEKMYEKASIYRTICMFHWFCRKIETMSVLSHFRLWFYSFILQNYCQNLYF